MRFGTDFEPYSRKLCLKPFPHRHTRGVHMLACVEHVEQPPQLALGRLAVPLHRRSGDLPLSGGGIGSKAVAQLP
jgi:hypothetical protein